MGSASASCEYSRGSRERSSSVSSFIGLTRLEDLASFFELLQLLALDLDFLFHLGDLRLELFGLFQHHLDGRLLLPRFAPFGLPLGDVRIRRFRTRRFR